MRKNRGITLIALVITIIILLILAGISISSLTNNGLLEKATQSKRLQIKAEMKEQLIIAIQELQVEKKGEVTLDDITEDWISEKLKDYEGELLNSNSENEKKIKMKKSGITGIFTISENLNIMEFEGLGLSYDILERNGNNIKISITIIDEENGINKIELPNKEPLIYNKEKEIKGIEYIVQLGEEYIVTITTGDGETKKEKILIDPEIQITEAYINTTQNATSSAPINSIEKETKLYISFTATLEGQNCTIDPPLTQEITKNGKYKYTITGTYKGRTITKTKEIIVNQYQITGDFVNYDAGEWTQEEIEHLEKFKLYDINSSHTSNEIFKLNSEEGLNLTFGGFTYKGNSNDNVEGVITSRNQSVAPQNGYGIPYDDGWQVLEVEEKEINGEKRMCITKLIHAGSPENFVFYYTTTYDAWRARYIFTGIEEVEGSCSSLSDGKSLEVRNWDMYKDKKQLELIDNVHLMTSQETWSQPGVGDFESTGIVRTNAAYWVMDPTAWHGGRYHMAVGSAGGTNWSDSNLCLGIRPVIELKEGVYIEEGDGTKLAPYVLRK